MFVFRGVGHGYVFGVVRLLNLQNHCECCAPKPIPCFQDVSASGGRCDGHRADYATQWSAGELCMHPKWISRREKQMTLTLSDVSPRCSCEKQARIFLFLCPFVVSNRQPYQIPPKPRPISISLILDHVGCFWQEPCEFWSQVVALGTLAKGLKFGLLSVLQLLMWERFWLDLHGRWLESP